MNGNLEDVKVKHTSTPISPGLQSNDQATLKVPSVKFQCSAIVSNSSTTTPVTTPALVSGVSRNPTVRPFASRSVPIEDEEYREKYETPLIIRCHMSKKNVCAVLERIQAVWKVQG